MIHVLVAVDLCEHSALTLEVAHALAKGAKGKVTVLHIVRLPQEPGGAGREADEEWSKMQAYALQAAERDLDRLLARIGLLGSVERRLRLGGAPHDVIVDEARAVGADLIVVGVHERPLLSRLFGGFTSARLQRRAPCPVVTVRSGAREDATSRKHRRAVMRAEVLE